MNILEIGYLYASGGAATVMHQIAEKLEDMGNKVYIIGAFNISNDKVKDGDMILFDKETAEINTSRVDMSNRYGLIDLKLLIKILKFAKKNKIQVIHLHAMEKTMGIREINILSKFYPIVWTMHCCWNFTGGCLHMFSCEKYKHGCKNCGYKDEISFPEKNYIVKEKLLTKGNIVFTSPSKWLKKMAKDSFLQNQKIKCIPNGIETNDTQILDKNVLRAKYEIPNNKKVLLFCAEKLINVYKGFSYLYDSFDKLDKDKYFMVAIGDTNGSKRPSEEGTYKYFGRISDRSTMNELYALADVFIIPSVQENFPCVVLEAMSNGLPVISFNVGGIPEQISGGCGYVCEEKSAICLKTNIEKLFEDETIYRKMCDNARNKVKQKYSMENVASEYMKLYKYAIHRYK